MAGRLGIQLCNCGGRIIAGSTELITVLLTDMQTVRTTDFPSGTPNPIGSPATVTITLTSPSGQKPVNQASMTADTTTTGLFNYTYQTASTSEQGLWYATFIAADGTGNVATFPPMQVFTIGAP